MVLSQQDKKLLWGKAGNRCSYNFNGKICEEELTLTDEEKQTILGDECHIIGEKHGAARHIENFAEMNTYNNRILMCKKHHKVIDDQEKIYTIEILKNMKREHEKTIAEKIRKKEIELIIIKDSTFRTEVKDAKEVINMEVNRPAQLSNVLSELKVTGAVERAVGFSTNQGLTIGSPKVCSNCGSILPHVFIGSMPTQIVCTSCGNYNS